MRVRNLVTGKWFFCNVESPCEAVVVAYEQNDNKQYGLTRYPGYSKHHKLISNNVMARCGNWVADGQVNKWNSRLYPGCEAKILHGPCRGFRGKVTKFCDSRTPYVDGVGFVLASFLYILS